MDPRSSAYLRGLLILTLGFLTGPLLLVLPVSFTPKRFLSLPEGEWSFRHYAKFFTDPNWLNSALASIGIALATAILCTLLATAFVIGLWLRSERTDRYLFGLVLLPMVVPQIISAMVIFFLESRLGLLDSFLGLVLAHSIMAVPYSVMALHVACSRLSRNLELASRSSGARTWQTALFVILPNIRFGVLTSAFLAFVISWEEVVVTLFVSGTNVITLPKRVWDGLRFNVDPVIAATAVIMMSLTVLAILGRAGFLLWKARRPGSTV